MINKKGNSLSIIFAVMIVIIAILCGCIIYKVETQNTIYCQVNLPNGEICEGLVNIEESDILWKIELNDNIVKIYPSLDYCAIFMKDGRAYEGDADIYRHGNYIRIDIVGGGRG